LSASAAPDRVPGKYERLARERQSRDLALAYPGGLPTTKAGWQSTQHPQGLWFDPVAAEESVFFVERFCRHHKGEWAGKLLRLEEWQRENRRAVFGWMRSDGTRRFRIVYIEVPRKNGKTEEAAATAIYLLVADGEAGAEVYSAATKKDQAKICHAAAVAMVKASPELRRRIKSFRNNLNVPASDSKFEPLGADSNTMDGLNPHGVIIDELHAHRDRGVYDVLDTAMGARRQPMLVMITTAGVYEPESIGWQQHQHAINVLEGTLDDDGFFAFIAAADPEDDWQDPATWRKANPNIGVSVKESHLATQAKKASQQPSFLNTFLRLHLNRWTQQRDRWIRIEDWNACEEAALSPAEYRAREMSWEGQPCWGGLDLSTKLDLSALQLVFPLEDGVLGVVSRFWVPEETILRRSQADRVPYDAWARDGWLIPTSGNVVDYDFIRSEIVELAGRFSIQGIGYDPWNATQLALQLQGDGFQMVEVRQGFKSLTEPCKAFEAAVVSRKVRHGGHPVLRWNVGNATLRRDANENIAPDKSASAERIDGVVALIMALGRAQVAPASAYSEGRGLQFIEGL
jgi:phage terminase large subunit-like protein